MLIVYNLYFIGLNINKNNEYGYWEMSLQYCYQICHTKISGLYIKQVLPYMEYTTSLLHRLEKK